MKILSIALVILFLSSCNSTSSGGPKITLNVGTTSSGITRADFFTPEAFFGTRVATSGQSTAAGLTSLKYYIRLIQICEELTVSGPSYSNPANCLSLYEKPENSNYVYTTGTDYSGMATVARNDLTNFTDLINSSSRSNLNTGFYLQSGHARSYNWGVIYWYPAVKFTASVRVNDVGGGTTMNYKTHDGTTALTGGTYFKTTSTSTFTNGNAEEAIVLHTNGGSWFKFQNPMVLTKEAIDSGTQYVLDLVLNPEGLIKGYASGVSSRSNVLRDASANEMNIPFLEIAPIPHKSSETVTKEAYLFDSTTASPAVTDNFNLRFDLYYVTQDSTKTIYAVETKTLYRMVGVESGSYTTTDVAEFPKISYVTQNSDGTLNFKIHNQSVVIQNFSRLTSNGSSGTVTINCTSAGWAFTGCAAGSSITMQYTLQSQNTL